MRFAPTAVGLPARRALAAGWALLAVSALAVPADFAGVAYDWTLPVFTKEGYYSMLARGSEARPKGRQFEVINLNLSFFTGAADNKIETVILSPDATFVPDAKTAHGEKSVRFIRDEVEASGTRWVYQQAEKKISLDGNVHVTFHAEFKDLLK